jgi:hypothetical protein
MRRKFGRNTEALGIVDLRYQTAISQRGRIAVAVPPGTGGFTKHGFDHLEPLRDPVGVPDAFSLCVHAQHAFQALQHAQIVQRMYLAGDGLGNGTCSCSSGSISGQQGRSRVQFIEILHDGQRLGEGDRAINQHRYQLGRVERGKRRRMLFPAASYKVYRDGLVSQSFQLQCDAHAVCRRTAKVGVKNQHGCSA